jgi:hypothetical protein
MVKCGVFFAVRTEFLNIIGPSSFKGLTYPKYITEMHAECTARVVTGGGGGGRGGPQKPKLTPGRGGGIGAERNNSRSEHGTSRRGSST